MGVEYRHFLVVTDRAWMPTLDTITRVDSVLRTWGIVEKVEKVLDLSDGRPMEAELSGMNGSPGHGLAVIYEGIEGEAVARIAGPSRYEDLPDSMRYTKKTSLVVGSDWRVHWSSEGIHFELASPPMKNGKAISAYANEELRPYLYSQSFWADADTSPPSVEIHVHEHAEANVAFGDFAGSWRGALVIDFGKDLPAWVQDRHRLPNMDFVDEIESAFAGEIEEVGQFH